MLLIEHVELHQLNSTCNATKRQSVIDSMPTKVNSNSSSSVISAASAGLSSFLGNIDIDPNSPRTLRSRMSNGKRLALTSPVVPIPVTPISTPVVPTPVLIPLTLPVVEVEEPEAVDSSNDIAIDQNLVTVNTDIEESCETVTELPEEIQLKLSEVEVKEHSIEFMSTDDKESTDISFPEKRNIAEISNLECETAPQLESEAVSQPESESISLSASLIESVPIDNKEPPSVAAANNEVAIIESWKSLPKAKKMKMIRLEGFH